MGNTDKLDEAEGRLREELMEWILEKRREGEVVVMGLNGPMHMPVKDFVNQPADGILYDLNRLEEVISTWLEDPKWVNDFAVAMTIRELKTRADRVTGLEDENTALLRALVEIEAYLNRGHNAFDVAIESARQIARKALAVKEEKKGDA